MATIILFIAILSVLVFVHEFGHFVTARKAGMKVYEFAIGFPPRAFGYYKDKNGKWKFEKGKGKSNLKKTISGEEQEDQYPSTLYSFNWLPLGGFVRIKGENGESADEPDSFGYQKAWKKVIVLCAGVVMNFLFAAIILGFGFMIGLPADVSTLEDKSAVLVEEPRVMIQQVQKDSPAEEAGLNMGDRIVSLNGIEIDNTDEMTEYVKNYGENELSVLFFRGEEENVVMVTPEILEEDSVARIGVLLVDAAVIRYPWYIAIFKGFVAAAIATVNILVAFYILIKGLLFGHGMAFDIAGPVGIAAIIGDSARLGISHLINVTAMISLSLAVINILPIPALDGGRVLFVLIGKIIRRPVPLKWEQLAHTLGFGFLMLLIIVVTVRDVLGLI